MMKLSLYRTRFLATSVLLFLIAMNVALYGKTPFLEGHTRFVYRTETDSSRIEETTTEITPLDDGRYRVMTTTEEIAAPDNIRLAFFGGSFQWLGVYMSEGASALFDLSPLGALANQELEPHRTYLLPDGRKLETGDRVMVAGLSGVEGIYTQGDTPGAIIQVVLADDLYIRQFLPFPLRVQLEYEGMEGDIVQIFSGTIELVAYVHTPMEEGRP